MMNEPLRWLEDPESSARLVELLESAPEAPRMPEDLQKKVGAFAVGLLAAGMSSEAAAAAALATQSTAGLLGAAGTVKAVTLVLVMGSAGVLGYGWVGNQLQSPVVTESSEKPPAVRAPSLSGPQLPAVATGLSQSEGVPSLPDATQVRSSRAITKPSANTSERKDPIDDTLGAASVESPSIADEAVLLELARSQLGQDPVRALETVRHHQRDFPSGQLSAERELIAVDALLRLGRRKEAERRAAPLLQRDPMSLYARRLRQLLVDADR